MLVHTSGREWGGMCWRERVWLGEKVLGSEWEERVGGVVCRFLGGCWVFFDDIYCIIWLLCS